MQGTPAITTVIVRSSWSIAKDPCDSLANYLIPSSNTCMDTSVKAAKVTLISSCPLFLSALATGREEEREVNRERGKEEMG